MSDEPLTDDERAWLNEQLHSPQMQCRQCEVTRRLLLTLIPTPRSPA